jgi:putative phosphoribosyl transferase
MVHLPFADRLEAGRLLAMELWSREIAELQNAADVVLALARGGIPVGLAVADRLRIPLEVIVVRKLGVPAQPELAMGAIVGGTRILDNKMIRQLGISEQDIEDTLAREQAEMRRREDLYLAGKPTLVLNDKSVIIVDDGLATGTTMLAAVLHVRDLKPARMIIGVPVGSRQACNRLRPEVDDLVCLATPEHFLAVGPCYRDFEQVNDAQARG